MRILELVLNNFKGQSGSFVFNGKNAIIKGDNGAGKTSVMDAFFWLITGKDHRESTKFEIKTLDENNCVIHNEIHSVKCVFDTGNDNITLERQWKEKWVKQHGSTDQEFQGHETSFLVDDIPQKQKDFDKLVTELFDDKFALLSNINAFNSLHWQKMREALLEMSGEVSTEELLNAPKYSPIKNDLSKHSSEDLRKKYKSQAKTIKQKIEEVPARIDEVKKSIREPEVSKSSCEKELDKHNSALEDVMQKIRDAKSGNNTDLLSEKSKLNLKMSNIKNDYLEKHRQEVRFIRDQINDIADEMRSLESDNIADQSEMQRHERRIKELDALIPDLRKEYNKLFEKNWDGDTECPTCHQALPAEQVEKLKSDYNDKKAEKLKSIQERGKKAKAEKEDLEAKIDTLAKEISGKQETISQLQAKKSGLDEDLAKLQGKEDYYSEYPEYKKAQARIEAIDKEIRSNDNSEHIEKLTKEKISIEEEVRAIKRNLQVFDNNARAEKRIKELKEDNKKLSGELESLEENISLVDDFDREKMEMIESSVNDLFPSVKFKLFEEQINGGIRPTCITLMDGVPYNENLNMGGRMNAGLEIVDTLQQHYGIEVPVFVDNAESVSKIYPTRAQLIRLIKPTENPPKKLKMELFSDSKQQKQLELTV